MAESIGTALRSTSEKAKGILGEAGASRRDEGGTKEGRRRDEGGPHPRVATT